MEETRLLRSLRAVRLFSKQPIPAPVLDDILDAARWTGSSKNSQPWELVVVEDRDTLVRLAHLGQFAGHLAGARLAVVLVMGAPYGRTALDAGRLAQNIMLAAWAHGVGSCIASLFPDENERRAREILGVPDDRTVHTAISLGYPQNADALRVSSAPPEVRSSVPLGRRSLHDLVSWERFGRRDR